MGARIGQSESGVGREDTMSPEARVLGFVILMVAVFFGAYKAGSFAGPVIPAHAPVHPAGGTRPSMNMNMGAGPAVLPGPRDETARR
jgi:hypothetical protein